MTYKVPDNMLGTMDNAGGKKCILNIELKVLDEEYILKCFVN